ncbi:MAG: SH3 domain-containing protein [Clostridia bacterium]|nr:SH3 domain-containing protein [Clostridia bacterium]
MKKAISILMVLVLSLTVIPFTQKAKATEKIYGAGKVTTTSTALNVRSSASGTSTVKAKLSKDSYVTLISKIGSFWRVQYSASGYGYCHADYIETYSTKVRTVKTTSGRLRVRSSASGSADIKDYLSSGTQVTVLSTSGSFSRILYNGRKRGYVASSYLTTEASTSGSSYKAIKLSVPSFKQTDSRWANVTLGSSGQTIGRIGCATTAIAMLESYRTGTTIYPNAMAKKLSYTSGGAVYWPSYYTIITSSSGYLSKIYNLLKAGKPVLIGAKKSNGSQHYVVITGVKATNTLTTSSFYINDPGSDTRTTLNQFFAVYPNFYKMMSY